MRLVTLAAPVLVPLALLAGQEASAEALSPLRATAGGCTFQLSPRTRPGGFPPLTEIVLTREDAPGCAAGGASVVLGTSYQGSALSLLVTEEGVAVGFTSRATPSGSAAVFVQLRHVDPLSLSVLRAASLGALNPSYAGYVYSGVLELLPDGTTLEVRGSKHGVIPGETGGGGQYVATWPDFFTSATPPEVVAYDEPTP
ncbi:hypothetical protein [Archangium primigenium]|uniref:hypothetical protein n=1 Tax=[Archangium] primigenium TaxID=2792470 RepID=UPI00195A71F7|nr:hypothetical protein [Archangium primigenium]MBM7114773.1 hypothetical protein [Archangium primigenium]